MLTPLGSALTGWRPSRGAAEDPLATIRAAWSEIVGEDVARAAAPVALVGSALVVITASSSWSHQLSFLERTIIGSVNALGVHGVERLRFRIGTVRASRAAAPRRVRRSAIAPPLPGRPSTTHEALARLRTVIETRRDAHGAAGGAFCATCNAAIPAGSPPRCRPCADAAERAQREACERILFQAPWLAAEEVLNLVPGLTPEAYDRIRRRLLRAWTDELRLARKRYEAKAPVDAARIRQLASSYVLLETRIDPNRLELDSPVRQNALGDLYPFIRTVETGI
jgi:hypothetical protein